MESTTIISNWIAENFFWVFIAILFLNMLQRRHHETASKKRFATLYLGIAAFGVFVAGTSIVEFSLSDMYLIPAVGIIGTVLYIYRDHTFPFRLHCRETGKRLTWEEILYDDSNLSAEAKEKMTEQKDEESGD